MGTKNAAEAKPDGKTKSPSGGMPEELKRTQKNPPPQGRGLSHVLCQLSETLLNLRQATHANNLHGCAQSCETSGTSLAIVRQM